jgi:hypothetical protein
VKEVKNVSRGGKSEISNDLRDVNTFNHLVEGADTGITHETMVDIDEEALHLQVVAHLQVRQDGLMTARALLTQRAAATSWTDFWKHAIYDVDGLLEFVGSRILGGGK